jgi:hypothetical protein
MMNSTVVLYGQCLFHTMTVCSVIHVRTCFMYTPIVLTHSILAPLSGKVFYPKAHHTYARSYSFITNIFILLNAACISL